MNFPRLPEILLGNETLIGSTSCASSGCGGPYAPDLDDYQSTVLPGLELACYLAEQGTTCANVDLRAVPRVRNKRDLGGVKRHFECLADQFTRAAGGIVVEDVPEELVEGFRRAGLESYYPAAQGERLVALLEVEAALRRFSSAAEGIKDVLREVSIAAELYKNAVDEASIRGEMAQVELAIRSAHNAFMMAQSAMGMLGGNTSSAGAFVLSMITGTANLLNTASYTDAVDAFLDDLEELQSALTATELSGAALEFVSAVNEQLVNVRQLTDDIAAALEDIQSGVAKHHGLTEEAKLELSQVLFATSDPAAATYHLNTAMRSWMSDDLERYHRLLDSAKRMAFVARKAIEFRLGVDLHEMHGDLMLVPAPSSWVDSLCTMRGINYDDISGRYEWGEWDDLVSGTAPGWSGSYAGGFIADYVRNLRLLVEGYPIEFPFQDGTDVVVLSLRDDVFRTRLACRKPSYNLLRSSGSLRDDPTSAEAGGSGWFTEPRDETVVWLGPADVGEADAAPAEVGADPVGRVALEGLAACYPDPPFVGQRVERDGGSGRYVFDFWARRAAESPWAGADTGEVRGLGEVAAVLRDGSVQVLRSELVGWVDEWRHVGVVAEAPADAVAVEVRFYPNIDSVSSCFNAADWWVAGMQLQAYDGPRGTWEEDVRPSIHAYEATDEYGESAATCPDFGGESFRGYLTRGEVCDCPARRRGRCPPRELGDERVCARVLPTFAIPLLKVDGGRRPTGGRVAGDNFNYRIEDIGINIVGTNVRSCATDDSPESCYGAAFVEYVLRQEGDVRVRNYEDRVLRYDMPAGVVNRGKALAAEVVLTNPPTSSHMSLMSEYMKDELRGRPLQGDYQLRILDDGTVDWDAIEDIQIVLRYRYWTRME